MWPTFQAGGSSHLKKKPLKMSVSKTRYSILFYFFFLLFILTSCWYLVLLQRQLLNWNAQKQIRDNNIYLSYLVRKPSLRFQIVER